MKITEYFPVVIVFYNIPDEVSTRYTINVLILHHTVRENKYEYA